MASAFMQQSALHIGRIHNHYLVAAQHQAAEEVRNLCEDAIATTLSEALRNTLERLLPVEDPGLWFIRRLDVDFAVNTEIMSNMADTWAKEIVGAWQAAVQTNDEENTVYFPERAAFVANFLLDLSEGSAWNKWYYSGFDGLRMLSVSAAIRTTICDSSDTGLRALLLLSEAKLARVVGALPAVDARSVLAAVAACGQENEETICFQAITDVWPATLGTQEQEEDRRALLLFLAASRKQPMLAGETLRASVVAFAHLEKCLHEGASAQNQALMAALREGSLAALYGAGLESTAVLAPLLRCSVECLGPLFQRAMCEPFVNVETRRETRFTAFGGAFLLLPLLDEFPLENATRGWPELGNIRPAALARLVILAKCFGTSHAQGCFCDPVVRDLMQISPEISFEMVTDWMESLSADELMTFLREISSWHTQTGAIEGETFLLTGVDQGGKPVALLLDSARALWLLAMQLQSASENFVHQLSDLPGPKRLVCCPSLWHAAKLAFPEAQFEPLTEHDGAEMPSLKHLVQDLAYLSLREQPSGACAADLALSVAAQCVMRLFACKLPGFAHSSMDYLYSNFLDCFAALEETEDRRIVSLGRPPLHLVLGMAGLNRCSYRLSWLDGRPCAIFPEG
jgi:hypothetical protein